jgi:hypothetical protein
MYAWFESTNRARLETLRTDLFGRAEAERAQTKQDREAGLQAHLDSLPENERQAATMQMFLSMKAKLDAEFAAQVGDLGPPPPELAPLADLMRQKIDDAIARAREQIAQAPPSPETLRRINEMLKSTEKESPFE